MRHDRGVTEVNITLYAGTKPLWWKQGVELSTWIAGEPTSTDIPIPKIAFDRIRVEVTKWVQVGGGLAEIEIFQDRWTNIARGCAAKANAIFNNTYPAEAVSDGVKTSYLARNHGFWLLPDHTAGWVEIDLTKKSPPAPIEIPKDAAVFERRHYKAFFERLTWHQAEEVCQTLGGHLASVHSKEENDFIQGLRQDRMTWFGGTDYEKGKVGNWRWTDGSPFKFQNWSPGEPNNAGGKEFYLAFINQQSDRWNDVADKDLRDGYICEWDK
jgi:hypothetical protein